MNATGRNLGVSAVIAVVLAGCATIIHSTTQQIGIGSNPSNASVTIDGASFGRTPTIASLKRGDNHIVKIELEGYRPYEMAITKKVSGWVWGNLVFGGLIGLAVDAISGGLYTLTPEQIQADLRAYGAANLELGEDGIYIFATLHPDPSWRKVGQLRIN